MRKKVSVLAITLLVVASTGVVAQSDGLVWDPSGEVETKNATQDFNYAYSTDGDDAIQPGPNPNELVSGLEVKNGVIYTLAYTERRDGSHQYEGWAYDISNNYEPIIHHPGTLTHTETEMLSPPLAFDIKDGTVPRSYGNEQNIIFANTVDEERLVQDGDGTIETYVSSHAGANTDYHVVTNSDNDQQIVYTNKVTVGEREMILVQSGNHLVEHNTSTHTNTELIGHGLNENTYFDSRELTNNTVLSHRPFSSIDQTDGAFNRSATAQYYNFESEKWTYLDAHVVGMNDKYIALSNTVMDPVNTWNNHTIIFEKEDLANILENTPSSKYDYTDLNNHSDVALEIPNPENVSQFEYGMYESGKWIFIDKHTEKAYVYSEDLSNLETVVNQPWKDVDKALVGFESYIQNGTIHLASFDDNEIAGYDTKVEVESSPGLCAGHLNPQELENFWETKNVCWLPIYMGTGILNSIYQWLILAILIAMPIAKTTESDIATMATIDGVLIVAMLIGRISPGYVAIALLSTILLSLYGTRGGDVNVDIGTGEL